MTKIYTRLKTVKYTDEYKKMFSDNPNLEKEFTITDEYKVCGCIPPLNNLSKKHTKKQIKKGKCRNPLQMADLSNGKRINVYWLKEIK